MGKSNNSDDKGEGEKKSNEGHFYPLKSDVPKIDIPISKAAETLRKDGVQLLYIGDGNHKNIEMSEVSNQLAISFGANLMPIEQSHDTSKKHMRGIVEKHFSHIPKTTEIVPVDWKASKKDPMAQKIREYFGSIEATEILEKHTLSRTDFKKGELGDLLHKLSSASATKTKLSMPNNTMIDQIIEERASVEGDYEVAVEIVNNIQTFYQKNGYMPTVVIPYGGGHFEDKDGIDELVAYELNRRGLPEMRTASISLEEGNSTATKIKYEGRDKTGAGFDYSFTVSDKGPKLDSQLGSPLSEKIIGPAMFIAAAGPGTPMNAVIDAFNRLDDAAAATPEYKNLFLKYKYQDNGTIPDVKKGELLSDYISTDEINKLNGIGRKVATEAARAVFDDPDTKSAVPKLHSIDRAFDSFKSGVENRPEVTGRSK